MEGIVEVVPRSASHTLREEKGIGPILTVLPNPYEPNVVRHARILRAV
jgi:hypothetical protein